MNWKFFTLASLFLLLAACGGGGGGSSTSCISYSQYQYCTASGLSYYCYPAGGMTSSCFTTASGSVVNSVPTAQPFSTSTAIRNIVTQTTNRSSLSPTPFTPTIDYHGRMQVAAVQIIKSPANSTFNGASATKQTTSANWSGIILASDYQNWYVTPYDLYYDTSNNLAGFTINGMYGRRNGGASMPDSANDQATGQIGQFDVYSDASFTTRIGTASFTYRVNNCCDLFNKEKASLILTLTGNINTGTFTLTQTYVITTSGSISAFAGESYNNGSETKKIQDPYGGY